MAWRKVTGVLAAAAAGVLLLGSPAFAAAEVPLHDSHEGSTADGHDCGAPFANGQDMDGWHFVLQGQNDFEKLTLTFDDAGTAVNVVITSRDPLNPDEGADATHAWKGFIWKTGGGVWKHAYVFTEPGWSLTTGMADTSKPGTFFNLSHTCAGDGTPGTETSTTTTTTTTTSGTPDPDDPAPFPEPEPEPTTPAPTPDPTSDLPVTGPSLTGLIIAGAALVLGGSALLFLRRRRTDASA